MPPSIPTNLHCFANRLGPARGFNLLLLFQPRRHPRVVAPRGGGAPDVRRQLAAGTRTSWEGAADAAPYRLPASHEASSAVHHRVYRK